MDTQTVFAIGFWLLLACAMTLFVVANVRDEPRLALPGFSMTIMAITVGYGPQAALALRSI